MSQNQFSRKNINFFLIKNKIFLFVFKCALIQQRKQKHALQFDTKTEDQREIEVITVNILWDMEK